MSDTTGADRREILKNALAAIDELQQKLYASERANNEPIAIVGVGCRLPGGVVDLASLWPILRDGIDATRAIPADRWDTDAFYDEDPEALGKIYIRRGGFLDHVDLFDARFFGIAPREALNMDPQHRLTLEVAWETLENAGQNPEQLIGSRTGVFIGITTNDYAQLVKTNGPDSIDAYHFTGNHPNFAAGRIAYILGLQGPTMAVDSACSSSLVSVHLACQSLRGRECDLALAGGVNLILSPLENVTICKARMLAKDGRCKTFDARADGYARSEGCGMVALKRMSDAQAHGDSIYALIRGSAVNQDGASSGLTVPNAAAQQLVIREAIRKAGIAPAQISYVETHGTGTALGDPIEVRALNSVLGENRPMANPLQLGTVKTNIGHLESAAGIAGLIKVVASLQHREIPPVVNLRQLNPAVDWDDIPVVVPTKRTPWLAEDQARMAGVSSFGASGTNAHLILEEAPKPEPVAATQERTFHLLTLSAKSTAALKEMTNRYQRYLADHPETSLGDACFTANVGRKHFDHRQAFVADSAASMANALAAFSSKQEWDEPLATSRHPRVVFLFTGQGSQYAGMGRKLFETQPLFRQTLENCHKLLREHLEKPLLSVLYPSADQSSALDETIYTQPALFALEYALASLWLSWGIVPVAVMGHSVGEYVAACIAGVFSLEEGLSLIVQRARLMDSLPQNGAMAAVMASEAQVREAIDAYPEEIAIAAVNGSDNVVVSGIRARVQSVADAFAKSGIRVQPLKVSHAFHSPQVEPILDAFEKAAQPIPFKAPRIPLVSNVKGDFFKRNEIPDAHYWRRHIRYPVLFFKGMVSLASRDYSHFLEIGPQPILLGMGRRCIDDNTEKWLPSLRKGGEDWRNILESLAALYKTGVDIDWPGFDRGYARRRVALPTYPFQRKRYWAIGKPSHHQRGRNLHPLIHSCSQSPLMKEILFESTLNTDVLAFLKDHVVHGMVVFPAAAYIEMALCAAEHILGNQPLSIENLVIHQALILSADQAGTVQLLFTPSDLGGGVFRIISFNTDSQTHTSPYVLHAEGQIVTEERPGTPTQEQPVSIESLRRRYSDTVKGEDYYDTLNRRGLQFGSGFRGIENIWHNSVEGLGEVRLADGLEQEPNQYRFHPALLDACLQVSGITWPSEPESASFLPFSIERFRLFRRPPLRLWSHAARHTGGGRNSDTLSGDIRLFEDSGQLVAEIKAFTVKRSNAETMLRAAQKELDALFYEIQWRPKDEPGKGEDFTDKGYLPTPDAIAAGVAKKVAGLADQHHLSLYEELFPKIDVLCADYILRALRELLWNPVEAQFFSATSLTRELGIIERHELFLGRLLEILAEDGIIERTGSGFISGRLPAAKDLDQGLNELLERYPEASVELRMTAHFGRHLASGLRGESDPLELLFPGGSVENAERLYQDAPYFRFYNRLAQEAVSTALAGLPPGRKIRILEIGAGTGGTTAHILPCLPSDRTEYVFTDVSNLFLTKAREKFAQHAYMHYQILDIEKAPQEQGMELQQFDVIVAANVLHATTSMRQTLTHVKSLLKPQGLLLLLEAVRLQRFADLIVGLTEGWWRFSDKDLRPSHALMPTDKWLTVLEQTGFEGACALRGKEINSGAFASQAIILASRPHEGEQRASAKPVIPKGIKKWLVFNDRQGLGAHLPKALDGDGQQCTWVTPGERFEDSGNGRITVNPGNRRDFDRLIGSFLREPAEDHLGVIFLWALDAACSAHDAVDRLEAWQELICGAALHLVQAMVSHGCTLSGFWLVTAGAQAVGYAPQSTAVWQASLWGFGRTVAIEHPELSCVLVDLDLSDPLTASQMLARELLHPGAESQVAWRQQTRYVARLTPKISIKKEDHQTGGLEPLRVINSTPGILDGLRLQAATRRTPGDGEVEILVEAAALNFRDVLMAMDMYPDALAPLGIECAGRIEAIGPNVDGLRVGDEVVAIAPGSLGTFALADARLVAPRPRGLSFEEASMIPSVFLTADYTLHHVARITAKDRILIHAAAGGVGLAAVQMAKRIGAEVFATAGNAEKRDFVKSLGVKHVLDSRTLAFADEIMALTDGRGVDVVLNCLSGDFITKSLSVLAAEGRFVEIGRRDIWAPSRVAEFRNDVAYSIVNVLDVCRQEPVQMGARLTSLVEAFEQQSLHPLPMRVFPIEKAVDGFRHMAQAKHIGKIVFVNANSGKTGLLPGQRAKESHHAKFEGDGVFLVTGGLNGLGLEVAQWLTQQGARDLYLMGRSAPCKEAEQLLSKLRGEGARITVICGDVTNYQDLERVRTAVEKRQTALKGIFHCAGVLADNVLEQQDWSRFSKVFAPKITGSWNLHLLTHTMPVEVFVLFSSVVSVLGSAGQANHAAACAFEDALAHYRRERGLAGLSINWGPWSAIGSVVKHHVGDRLRSRGIQTISPQEGLHLMQRAMDQETAQVTALRADWQQFMKQFPADRKPSLLAEMTICPPAVRAVPAATKISSLTPQLEKASPNEARKILQGHVRETVIQVFGLEPSATIDWQQGLRDIGMDSLMSLELRNRLQASTEQSLPSTLAFDCPTMGSLVAYLSDRLLTPIGDVPKDADRRNEVLDDMSAAVEQLSDEEAEALLLEELSRKPR